MMAANHFALSLTVNDDPDTKDCKSIRHADLDVRNHGSVTVTLPPELGTLWDPRSGGVFQGHELVCDMFSAASCLTAGGLRKA